MSDLNHLLDEDVFRIRLAFLEERNCLYRPLLRPLTVKVMNRALFDHGFAGATDASALSLISMFIAICQPEKVLELGTYRGFSALILSELLNSNERTGRLVTVDPNEAAQAEARRQIYEAGLESSVRFVCGLSTDQQVLDELQRDAPFDLLYLDTSHEYETTMAELETYLVERRMVRPGGLVFLHDISFPMGNDKGVGAAVEDWRKRRPEFHYLPLAPNGIWPNPCGLGILLVPPERRS